MPMSLHIDELIRHPEQLTDKLVLHELSELIAAYPYYTTARLLFLKGLYLTHNPAFGEELRRTALYVSDRKTLFYLIEGDYYTLKPAVRKAPQQETETGENTDRTQELIDAFLSTLPEEDEPALPISDEEALRVDYPTYILREEELPALSPTETEEEEETHTPYMKGQDLIDNFINNADEKLPAEEHTSLPEQEETETDVLPSIEEDDGYFTETLAKIYIKQHRYSKAYEIIKRLSLKYPKKNAYFADQIRFLEKLMENSNDK